MLSRHLRTFSITVCVCVAYGPLHTYAQSDPNPSAEIANIVTATVSALGANPSSLPPYQEELSQARESADKVNYCDDGANMKILNPVVLPKILSRTIELIKSGEGSALISERPKYMQDLILASIASFEAGRFAASPESYRENLCQE